MKTITLPFSLPQLLSLKVGESALSVKAMTLQPPARVGQLKTQFYESSPRKWACLVGRRVLQVWRNPFRERGAILAAREPWRVLHAIKRAKGFSYHIQHEHRETGYIDYENHIYIPGKQFWEEAKTPEILGVVKWNVPQRMPAAFARLFVEVEEVFAPNRLEEMSLDEYRSLLGETRPFVWKGQVYEQAQAKRRESVRVRWNAAHPRGPKWIADEPGPWVWTARVRRVEKPDADDHD